MARAQTYIITKNQIYGYSSTLHNDNHNKHLVRFYQNLKITEYIPVMLSKNGECVIDLISHGNSGSIYLPETLIDYQSKWLIDKQNYLSRFSWNLCDIVDKKSKIYDEITYDEVIKIINLKKQL